MDGNEKNRDEWGFPAYWPLERKIRTARSGLNYLHAVALCRPLTASQRWNQDIYLSFLAWAGVSERERK